MTKKKGPGRQPGATEQNQATASLPSAPRPIKFVHRDVVAAALLLRHGENPITWRCLGVALALACCVNGQKVKWRLAHGWLARILGVHRNVVQVELKTLERRGLLKVEPIVGRSVLTGAGIAGPGS